MTRAEIRPSAFICLTTLLCIALAGLPASIAADDQNEPTARPDPPGDVSGEDHSSGQPEADRGTVQEDDDHGAAKATSAGHHEAPPPEATRPPPLDPLATAPARIWRRGAFQSVQVNVDALGNNIIGDAANEPSIAVDPNNADRVAIGWRQFDTINNNFRQSGWAYTQDGGQNWTFPGVLEPGEFSSDPILDSDSAGNFYYYGLQPNRGPGSWACYLYKSGDGGVSWPQEVYAFGGDKAWLTVDKSGNVGDGNVYLTWNPAFSCCGSGHFTRSTDGGLTFLNPIAVPNTPVWGTLSVGPDGALYIGGVSFASGNFYVSRSSNAQNSAVTPVFEQSVTVNLGGQITAGTGPNPGGLLGQTWIATDHSNGPTAGNVYLLCSVNPPGGDPLDVMFARSEDGGATWSNPVRINDDPGNAWQWFGTMSVAPTGRIDVIWNDTRNTGVSHLSELHYANSTDGGLTWSENVALSPVFNSHVGWPDQSKIGDYYDMVSDDAGAHIAYSATFNGEQDVYYLRLSFDCDTNGIPDRCDLSCAGSCGQQYPGVCGQATDCNTDSLPDNCQLFDNDCNTNSLPDDCDIASGLLTDENGNGLPDECELRRFVDPDAGGSGTGLSWADAYSDLTAALTAARTSIYITEIWVAAGRYTPAPPNGDRSASFELGNRLGLYGGFAGHESRRNQRDPAVNVTILSGDLNDNDGARSTHNGENSYNVVTAVGPGLSDAVLDGFVVTGGNANSTGPQAFGAGMHVALAQVSVVDCIFIDGFASFWGGGLHAIDAVTTLDRCVFLGNRAFNGAAVSNWNGQMTLINCALSGNAASGRGGGLFNAFGDVTATNCTFADNTAGQEAGGLYGLEVMPVINSCVFWNNTDGGPADETAQIDGVSPSIDYSCVQGWSGAWGGAGNIGTDPALADADGLDDVAGTADDNLRLLSNSPGLDAGDPTVTLATAGADLDGHARVLCDRVDMGAYEFGIGDFDCDRDADLTDFASWPTCMTGPNNGPYAAGCEAFDYEFDDDVDLADHAAFQRTLAGN
ncbi:MAG: exo-alpha-sialidase [Planctomycetes bacterium]|nr:exo-alpha-sialidase [Planctomycetota bacterium]